MFRVLMGILSSVVVTLFLLMMANVFLSHQDEEQAEIVFGVDGEHYDPASGMSLAKPTSGAGDGDLNVSVPMTRTLVPVSISAGQAIAEYYHFGEDENAYNPNESTFGGMNKVGIHENVVEVLGDRESDALFILSKSTERETFLADSGLNINDGDVWNLSIWELYDYEGEARVLVRCDCGQDRIRSSPYDRVELQTLWELWSLSYDSAEPVLRVRSNLWSDIRDGRTPAERNQN